MCRSSRSLWLLALVSLLALAEGCLPFVSPPLRVRAGALSGQRAQPERPQSAPAELAVGIHPLQSTDHYAGPVDLGVGYRFEGALWNAEQQRVLHGPELELGLYPLRHEAGGSSSARAGLFTELSWLGFNDFVDETGFGVSLGGAVELTGFSASEFASDQDDGFAAGVAAGQWAIGFYVAASYRNLGTSDHFVTSLGLSGRIPFFAGVICCLSFDPEDSTSSVEEAPEDPTTQASAERKRQAQPRPERPAQRPSKPVRRQRANPKKETE